MMLRGPLTGGLLEADTPHSLRAAGERWPVVDGIPFLRGGRAELAAAAAASYASVGAVRPLELGLAWS